MNFRLKQPNKGSTGNNEQSKPSIFYQLFHLLKIEQIISLSSILFVLILWSISTYSNWVQPLFLPSPTSVLTAFLEILRDGYKGNSLIFHIYQSMYRLFVALLLAVVTAIPIGMLSGFSKYIRAAIDPLVEFYRPLPPLAYYTLLVIWLGIEDSSKNRAAIFSGFCTTLYCSGVGSTASTARSH
ncbi:MAG: hypothetical protein HEQ35_31260 [Gloeotrichia echinulata IR180]|jgi:taurine transport system permease protein|nr:hypothetical protein [Gloeotrichia echinulata DEX184]